MTDKKIIPFSPPDISENEVQGVVEALKSGWITTGPKTKEFEKKIAEFCGTSKAVCLNSATACEESILRFLGIGEGLPEQLLRPHGLPDLPMLYKYRQK